MYRIITYHIISYKEFERMREEMIIIFSEVLFQRWGTQGETEIHFAVRV
jgi:hypothetical protein